MPHNDAEQRHITFHPIPRLDGIEPSEDPLLDLRATVYLMSGRRRRAQGRPVTESESCSPSSSLFAIRRRAPCKAEPR